MAESSYMIGPGERDAFLRRKMAAELYQKNTQPQQISHWTQGLAQLLNAGMAGYDLHSLDKQEREETARGNELMAKLLMGGQGVQPAPAPVAPVNPAMAPPMGNKVAAALAQPAPIPTNDRPKVASSSTVIGDDEGVKLGLYDPPKPGMAAPPVAPQASPQAALPQPAPMPAQTANGGTVAPGTTLQPGLNREALIAMLGNRQTRPMAQGLVQAQLAQQFKPAEYDFKERPDGSFVAINKRNPAETRIVQPGNAQDLIDFAARKEGATAQAKQSVERAGAAEFEGSVAGAKKRAELQAAKDIAKPDQDKQNQQVANIVTQDIDRAIKTIDTSKLPTTGAMGNVISSVGGTGAHDLSKLLDTVKSNAGFQELSKMRQASPTGAALGSVTERELALLQSTIGNLEQSQSETQLKDNLRRVKNTYLDIIHGSGNGPEREKLTFQEKAMAQPSIDELVKKYSK